MWIMCSGVKGPGAFEFSRVIFSFAITVLMVMHIQMAGKSTDDFFHLVVTSFFGKATTK